LTQRTILDAAIEQLERAPVSELTMRAVAARAGMSERTMFRYYATHADLLDAVTDEVTRRFDLPPDPTSVDALLAYPRALYARFEASVPLTKAALHSDLYDRVRKKNTQGRSAALQELVDRIAPARSARERMCAAMNMRYYLTATTWHYYRFYFGLSFEDTLACAGTAISQSLAALGVPQSEQ
jgi:AcrR family transcriptional regulator